MSAIRWLVRFPLPDAFGCAVWLFGEDSDSERPCPTGTNDRDRALGFSSELAASIVANRYGGSPEKW
jgi:hypothetical protein